VGPRPSVRRGGRIPVPTLIPLTHVQYLGPGDDEADSPVVPGLRPVSAAYQAGVATYMMTVRFCPTPRGFHLTYEEPEPR
jgi:hypothetical protein